MAELFAFDQNKSTWVNTTDATVTTLATFQTRTDKVYNVTATVVATETDDFDEVATYVAIGTFKNDGGTLSLVGSVSATHTGEDTAGWTATLDASGTTIRIRVTGAAATNISWTGKADITEGGKYVANYGVVT